MEGLITTVAYSNGVLAFDSLAVSGSIISSSRVQKGIATDKHLAACSGTLSFSQAFLEWVRSGFDPEKAPKPLAEDAAGAIVVDRQGRVTEYYGDLSVERMGKLPYCVRGSGGQVALGAILAGASAEEAVRLAAKVDVYTGGKIHSISFT